MGRGPLTQEQKDATSRRQKAYWDKCRLWGRILGVNASEVNRLWSSTVKPAIGDAEWSEDEPPVAVVESVKLAVAEKLLREAKSTNDLAESNYRRSYRRTKPTPKTQDEPPDLEARVKIMLWAIRTCGGIDLAQDALERAVAFRRQLDG